MGLAEGADERLTETEKERDLNDALSCILMMANEEVNI